MSKWVKQLVDPGTHKGSIFYPLPVADAGFPVGGRRPVRGRVDPLGGHGPPMQALFGKNVCENKRIGSCRGRAPGTPPRSANAYLYPMWPVKQKKKCVIFTTLSSV